MNYSRSAAIASITTAGYSIDQNCKDRDYIDGILLETTKVLPSDLMMPFNSKAEIDCLDMDSIHSEFSARSEFSEYFPETYSATCNQTIVKIINTCSAQAFQEMLTMITVYKKSLQNALDIQATEGEVVTNKFLNNKSKALFRMQDTIKCAANQRTQGVNSIFKQAHVDAQRRTFHTKQHILAQQRLKKANSLQILQNQAKLGFFDRDCALISQQCVIVCPLKMVNKVTIKQNCVRVRQISEFNYMCCMTFQVNHNIIQQPTRDLSVVQYLHLSQNDYLKHLYTHTLETTIKKCEITYSFVLVRPSSIVQDLELRVPSQVIEMQNQQGPFNWTKSSEMFNAVYTDAIPDEMKLWSYQPTQQMEAYHCIQCVQLIKFTSLNILTCQHLMCCDCVNKCTRSDCPKCLVDIQIDVESRDQHVQYQYLASLCNLNQIESKLRLSLKQYDNCYIQQQTLVNLKVRNRNAHAQADSEELEILRVKHKKHQAKKKQVQQLQAQMSSMNVINSTPINAHQTQSSLIQPNLAQLSLASGVEQKQQRTGLISSALMQQLMYEPTQEEEPTQMATLPTISVTRKQIGNEIEEIKQMQHVQDNVLNQQQVVQRATLQDDGQMVVTKEVFQSQSYLFTQDSVQNMVHHNQEHRLYEQKDYFQQIQEACNQSSQQQQQQQCASEFGYENPEEGFRQLQIEDCARASKENTSMEYEFEEEEEDTQEARQGTNLQEELADEHSQFEDYNQQQLVVAGPPVRDSYLHMNRTEEELEQVYQTIIAYDGSKTFTGTWQEFFLKEYAWRCYMEEQANQQQPPQ